MKKLLLASLWTILMSNANAQQKLYSNLQSAQNSQGVKTSRYNVNIRIKEPKKIGGDIGYITVEVIEIGSSLEYSIKYVKETTNADGVTYWYYIVNSERGELFNVVKVLKFKKVTLGHKYCIMLSKYSNEPALLYEHSYFAN